MATQSVDDVLALLQPLRADEAPAGPYERVSGDAYLRMSPDASATYEAAGSFLHLWTRRGPDDASWVGLVTSVSRPDRISLNAGYRVLADGPDEAVAMAADPARALATLVTRHGVSYFSGTKRVFLLPEHVIDISRPLDRLGPAEFQRAVALEEPPEGAQVAVNVALSTTSTGQTRLSWFFVLDLTGYAGEVAAHRR